MLDLTRLPPGKGITCPPKDNHTRSQVVWELVESNHRPLPFQRSALPSELRTRDPCRFSSAGALLLIPAKGCSWCCEPQEGFEPPTSCLQDSCSDQTELLRRAQGHSFTSPTLTWTLLVCPDRSQDSRFPAPMKRVAPDGKFYLVSPNRGFQFETFKRATMIQSPGLHTRSVPPDGFEPPTRPLRAACSDP